MDDGRLANEMTLEGIAKQLGEINAKVTAIDSRVTAIDSRVTAIDDKVTTGFKRVDEQLNAAKIRDEELHGKVKFSLEAREALRESMEAGFTAIDKKLDQDMGLLKDVLKHVSGAPINR